MNPRRKKPCTGDPRLHDAQIDDDAMDRTRMEPMADGGQNDMTQKDMTMIWTLTTLLEDLC